MVNKFSEFKNSLQKVNGLYIFDEVLEFIDYEEIAPFITKVEISNFIGNKMPIFQDPKLGGLITEIQLFYLIDLCQTSTCKMLIDSFIEDEKTNNSIYQECLELELSEILKYRSNSNFGTYLIFYLYTNTLIKKEGGVHIFLLNLIEHSRDLTLFKYIQNQIDRNISLLSDDNMSPIDAKGLCNLKDLLEFLIIPLALKMRFKMVHLGKCIKDDLFLPRCVTLLKEDSNFIYYIGGFNCIEFGLLQNKDSGNVQFMQHGMDKIFSYFNPLVA